MRSLRLSDQCSQVVLPSVRRQTSEGAAAMKDRTYRVVETTVSLVLPVLVVLLLIGLAVAEAVR